MASPIRDVEIRSSATIIFHPWISSLSFEILPYDHKMLCLAKILTESFTKITYGYILNVTTKTDRALPFSNSSFNVNFFKIQQVVHLTKIRQNNSNTKINDSPHIMTVTSRLTTKAGVVSCRALDWISCSLGPYLCT